MRMMEEQVQYVKIVGKNKLGKKFETVVIAKDLDESLKRLKSFGNKNIKENVRYWGGKPISI